MSNFIMGKKLDTVYFSGRGMRKVPGQLNFTISSFYIIILGNINGKKWNFGKNILNQRCEL